MNMFSLNGQWTVYQQDATTPIPASVPGCVHTDLLQAGHIDDPYVGDNELRTLWVGETDWCYQRRFDLPPVLLEEERVLLRCHGLDTLATIKVNGEVVGVTDNMFRIWEFDVKELLQPGDNSIEVHFAAAMPYVRRRGQERTLPAWGVGDHKLDGGGWIRKEPCNFGWDWGPSLVTCGIWRDIELVAFSHVRLTDVEVRQHHQPSQPVTLTVHAHAEQISPGDFTVNAQLALDGAPIGASSAALVDGRAAIQLTVENPQLWWPNGMGEQPLYGLTVQVVSSDGALKDAHSKRVGLRTLRLVREEDKWGESFYFAANGVPFFAKGANWIPADTFANRVSRADYARLLGDAALANMNMLRVWGGGIYEQDIFYTLCDELGICVWQDFMFACATYPGFDSTWLANVKAEAEDNVRRIRHHACLALWCGNNELEQGLVTDEWTDHSMSWDDYTVIFDDLLQAVVQRLDPQRDYWPSSPHSPRGERLDFNNPDWADAHLWSVWHGKHPFEWYRTCTYRFNSEFGFQSFPEPRTVRSYTRPEDRNITSFVMEHHQRSGIGNSTIIHYMLDWYRLPTSFDMTLWLSQILQGMAIKYAVEHWRRAMPRGMGTLYWQINDCWQVASWSSIDYFGNWKALHHMARKFYAPLLISALEDMESGTVEIHVTSDLAAAVEAVAHWTLTDLAGRPLAQRSVTVHAPERHDTLVETLALRNWLNELGARNLLLWLDLTVDGASVSTNLVHFARPKHLELTMPTIETAIETIDDNRFRVTLTTDRPALWTWLELSGTAARYADNFVHLRPGVPVTIDVTPSQPLSEAALRQQLQVRSLFDTYQD